MTRLVRWAFAVLAVLCLSVQARAAEARENAPLILAVHPYRVAAVLLNHFDPLARYLSRALGRPVQVDISPDYASHARRVGRGEVDISYLGPAPYIDLVREYGPVRLLSRQSDNGRPDFVGHVVVREGDGVAGLADLRGKRMAFGERESTMSHLVPRYMLLEAGINVEDLAEHVFLGSHDNVALGVLMGDFDAGAVKSEVYEKYRPRGLASLAVTPRVSNHLFVATSRVSPDLAARIRTVMLTMHEDPEGLSALQDIKSGVSALVAVDDGDYDTLRTVLGALRERGAIP
ncbi:MAG: phosphate/phosphite/phosphonate ABC transporter substrate-binding protein [Alphaproteobacteria bacterium]|nr:phosphate/phosphite/phosphonate ABC transporter substrate-binding protein [Alphaproteobacteria bacterium]